MIYEQLFSGILSWTLTMVNQVPNLQRVLRNDAVKCMKWSWHWTTVSQAAIMFEKIFQDFSLLILLLQGAAEFC